MALDQVYLDRIKTFEGFTPTAKWDYAQHTNGYGTRATHPGETIDKVEADRRFREAITNARRIVEVHASEWDEGTKAALTSLTFNAGTAWIKAGLGDAVRAHDIDGVRESFVKYVKAGGDVLQGLVNRRQAEVTWIGNPLDGASPSVNAPTQIASASAVASPSAWQTDVATADVPSAVVPPPNLTQTAQAPAADQRVNAAGLDLSARSWQALADLAIRDMLVAPAEERGESEADGDDKRLPSSALSSLSPARIA